MATVWKYIKATLVILVLVLMAWVVVMNYSVIFSHTFEGEITAVERVEIPVALITRPQGEITPQVFSFAVGIKDRETGEIHTASSEDRQWAVAKVGQCAEAVYLPYPPWNLTKKGTYFGARLVRLYECPK